MPHEILKSMIKKFTLGSQKLQSILNNQKAVFDRARIAYNSLRKQKLVKNIFIKAYSENHSIVCFKCNKVGQKILEYNNKKIGQQIWVTKEIMYSNLNGSKIAWVPKVKK